MANYDAINMTASFIPMKNCLLDTEASTKYRNEVNRFLAESQALILKDYQGRRWMVGVGNAIPQAPDGHVDNIVYNLTFTEIGNCDSTTDLYINGLSDLNVEGL